ncbi:cytochrome-c peroxidase [Pseudomonas turukhanskensis]|uniref:Cytochrome c domain-containing protein n=1 Tax=Pseudomonas turukhanskensis TaxID=1806536 RepID=A0A9W6NF55_9PSED|nr:cytochrome c peroxidase [Pseudomonas turukhanskensis]GLK88465.1 hypothetical protein GCM10017655_15270 [Pseudomonas turukhanskensis]
MTGALRWACAFLLSGLAQQNIAAPLDEPIKPIPRWHTENGPRAELGRQLFNDKRLSANQSISCASCHLLDRGGADVRAFSLGLHGQATGFNAPSVLNAALNFRQFWNGRSATLEEQINDVLLSPVEMGANWTDVLARLSADRVYQQAFAANYSSGITQENVQNALATYERTLTTPKARFDLYLEGDSTAITEEEKAGYGRFKQYGCISCHQGINVGGNMFQRFGVMGDYFKDRTPITDADQGRFAVTGLEEDRHVFKVPGLRNVEHTAPYFHDGSAPTLDKAVEVMFKYQLGRRATDEDTRLIILFLKTLSGEVQVVP